MNLPLSAYERYYQRAGLGAYSALFKLTDEKDIEADLCDARLPQMQAEGGTLKVLDIGCGPGTFTGNLLERLAHRASAGQQLAVRCDLVDINPAAFDQFRAAAENLADCDVTIGREIEMAWQNIEPSMIDSDYDLVIANHVFYGCNCDEELVRSLLRHLAPRGIAIVALVTQQSDLIHLRAEADIPNNTADDFGRALNGVFCNSTRMLYDSKFRFDPDDDRHREWFFAGAEPEVQMHEQLLARYAKRDDVSHYIANRAGLYLMDRRAA